ncbi:mechanosensitive ion channel family protein [Halogeometricum limi]|uniref:Small-conductance mechanosensitive channel n=1 Tax=Halogeometricum limi TaxID=555875 RepID=A0A1I6IR95_9EURY|nr:mechanosensitive ion channel domain-containing protein [Halogeometricum limi]SFR69236.1 Small-conductance mechanosensitive channel [Halogeometricum limi]
MPRRRIGYLSLALAALLLVTASVVTTLSLFGDVTVGGYALTEFVSRALTVSATALAVFGSYLVVEQALARRFDSKRRSHDARNVLRLAFGLVGIVAVLGVVTDQWVGVLFSLGIVGFAVTFALQQPLLSLIGWFYVMLKRPFSVGDRVEIDGTHGDVIDVGFLATTLWEIRGPLVSSGQPSGRTVTVPNAQVLSSQVMNYSTLFDRVWAELTVQVAYETDLAFAREVMVEETADHLGEEMAAAVDDYRVRLDETAVTLDVSGEPTVNVVQQESWIELRLRFLSRPRQITRNRNALYERIFARFNEEPERVKFPVGRSR